MRERSLWVPGADIAHRVFDSECKGPTVAISAAVHGDELTGIGSAIQLFKILPDVLVCGRIHVFPCLNPGGVSNRTRHYPGTKLDINRCFPGNPSGNPAERHAWFIWERLSEDRPDALIDLHADSHASIPYAIVDRDLNKTPGLSRDCLSLAASTGLFALWEYDEADYRRYGLAHSLSGSVVNHWARPAITIELGPRRQLSAPAVDAMTSALLGALAHLGMVDDSKMQSPRSDPRAWSRCNGPIMRQHGIFQPIAPLGLKLPRGTLIGISFSPTGVELERLLLKKEAMIISYPSQSFLSIGQACATLAVPNS